LYTSCVLGLRPFALFNDIIIYLSKKKKKKVQPSMDLAWRNYSLILIKKKKKRIPFALGPTLQRAVASGHDF
jgi:hypothetical protein